MKNIIYKFIKKYEILPIQVRASMWFLVCTIIQRSVSIITAPIFTRLMTTADYGKYNGFISWMGIVTCFVTMYIYSGVYPQTIVKYKKEKAVYSSAMQGLTVTLVALWILLYIFLSSIVNKILSLNTFQMMAMFLIMWGHAVFGLWSTEQRVGYKYRNLVLVTFIEAILQPLLSVILICNLDDKVTGLVWGIAIANTVCYFPLFVKQLIYGKTFFCSRIWKYTLSMAIPLIPHFISSVLLNSSDRIMIQKIIGESEAGIYSLAYTISLVGTLINQAMLQTLEPWVFEKIKSQEIIKIKSIVYPVFLFIALVNTFIILFAPEMMYIFGPEEYYDAIWVMPPIVMSVYFMFMYNLFSFFEFYFNKVFYVSVATGIGTFLNIFLNLIFIKMFGYRAAGYTTLICYIVFCITHYIFMSIICKRKCENEKPFDIKVVIPISIAFIFCGFLIMSTYKWPIIRYIVLGLIVLVCFILRRSIFQHVKLIVQLKRKL